MATDDLPFKVETWDANETRVEQLVAAASNAIVAIAAFKSAAEQYPTQVITLRNGARVMQHHRGSIPVPAIAPPARLSAAMM
jgi:hypothetical protein